jgi:DNA-binding LacI/PurR family transcriptional regulator
LGANIGDVARRAGVGRSTVSRVINERSNVDPETRRRVQRAIAELDYRPSSAARSLASGRSRTVGVVVPFLTRPSAVERISGIEAALAEADYDMVVFNVETPDRREHVMGALIQPGRIDGLIMVHLAPTEAEAKRLTRMGMPTVVLDAHHRTFTRVVSDDVAGGRLAARHLITLGHRRIGFVGDELRSAFRFSSSRLRLRGVRDALRESDLDLPPSLIATGDHSRRDAGGSAERMLISRLPPTAIVCASDTQAIGVLEASRRIGLPVPGALSVIGYDDIEIAELVGLTTIRQPLLESGRRAAGLLVEAIGLRAAARRALPRREVLDLQLVVRGTTSTPPV